MNHKVLYSYAGVATQILVTNPKFFILFDVGDGILRDLLDEGIRFPLSSPIHIFLTHGHFDHCGSLFSLLSFLRMLGQENPVNVYYPKGAKEIEGLIQLFISSYPNTIPFKLITLSLEQYSIVEITKKINVKAYQMKHGGSTLSHGLLPEIPALGYAIFNNGNKILAFTGDTGMNENLQDLVLDADHAYIEATYPSNTHSSYHLTSTEASKLGKLAKNYTEIHTLRKK
jgi:ribonuclease BN (tRNA processing enzyme)